MDPLNYNNNIMNIQNSKFIAVLLLATSSSVLADINQDVNLLLKTKSHFNVNQIYD